MKLPPNYVNIPSAVIYSDLPPKFRDTYIQLRGLAWKSGYRETPPVTFVELSQLFRKSESTVYEHVRFLREQSWLQFRVAGGSAYTFSFSDQPKLSEDSDATFLVSENSETPINLLSDDIKPLIDSEKEKSSIPENRTPFSGKSQSEGKKRDQNLDHKAVIVYRSLVHLMPNAVQRIKIVNTVNDLDLWGLTIEHWLEHGWRPNNITGLLDSYRNGGKAGCLNCNRDDSRQISANGKVNLTDVDEVFSRLNHGDNS